MRNFAILYKPMWAHPRVKRFQARTFKDALSVGNRGLGDDFDSTKTPLMIVDFENERAEMVVDNGSGVLRVINDVDYGEETDFTRRVI